MDWGFKTIFSTGSDLVNANKSHVSIFERAKEERCERNQLREEERFFFIIWRNNNLHRDSTEHKLHCDFKNGLPTKIRHRPKHQKKLSLPSDRLYPFSLENILSGWGPHFYHSRPYIWDAIWSQRKIFPKLLFNYKGIPRPFPSLQ